MKDGYSEIYQNVQAIYASTPAKWRKWLAKNHHEAKSVRLIVYKKGSEIPGVEWSDAVDEALCFGWIDGKRNKRDEESYYQFYTHRNPKSSWSRINKNKVTKLLKAGKMEAAGLKMIEIAKESGTWNALDDVENLVIPDDLQAAFDKNPVAFAFYQEFPRSSKRLILEWIHSAKRPETRQKRITETIEQAAQNLRANHFRQ